MKQETKEKIKTFFKSENKFELRVTSLFCLCFAILSVHTVYMQLIMQEIRNLDFNIRSGGDYAYSTYNNTEEIKELVSFNSGAITHYEYENHGTYTIVRVMPKNITDETVVSIMDGDEFLKAERDGEYFTVEVSEEPDFIIVKTEDCDGIYTDKIYLTDTN